MKKNLIYYLIILFPFLDLITALQTRLGATYSIGIFIKGIILLWAIYYIVFKSTSRFKKKSLLFLALLLLYVVLYFVFKPDLLNKSFLINELTYLFKILFLPVIFIGLLNYFDEYGFNKKLFIKCMKVTLIEYTLLLLIPNFLHASYDSYVTGLHGYVGWFYSANEVSIILIMLLPFLYYFLSEKSKFNFLIALPVLYAYSAVGTKVTLFGTVTITTIYFIAALIKSKFKRNNYTIGATWIFIIMLVFFFGFNPYTVKNMEHQADEQDFVFIETPKRSNSSSKNKFKKFITSIEESINLDELMDYLLSNRNNYYLQTKNIYENTFSYDYLITGMGFSNSNRINNRNIVKLIEIDYFDLYFHAGILGLIIDLIPIIIILVFICKKVFNRKSKTKLFNFVNGVILCMYLCAAGIAGHLLFYPAATLYLLLYLFYIYGYDNYFEKEKIDYSKVQILALHLKQGGIETVLTNQANMLSKDYHVEIISLYDNHYSIPYKLNDGIKVTYLMTTISNREELKAAINSKNPFRIIKEGIKAIRILYLKPLLLKETILNSNAGTIISTRSEFSKLLGKYKRDGVLTIGEEHVYHANDPKRINLTIKGNKHVDYLLPTSKELVEFYKPLVKSRVEYIPNVIKYYPDELNKLNNKKLIAIGRLTPEKGFIDLIPIMKEIVKKDKNVTLDIYGSGPEKEKILNEIKKNKLENNIFLKEFVKLEKLNELRTNYTLMVIPSYEESFGLAALESMAFGIPCVIYDDAKGLQEFITNENGIIISNRDYKKFASSVLDLLNDKKTLKKLSEASRKTSENYSYNKIQKEFIEFLNNKISIINKLHRKVMFISSTGGHFNELSQLKSMFDRYDYEIVTEKTKTNANLKKKYNGKLHYLLYGTRFHPLPYFLLVLPGNCFISLFYFLKYRPEFIITTGAHTAGPMCCIGKLFGSKIIYIESFANSKTKTATGKIIYKFADLFIVQWEDMTKLYPDAVLGGWIF